MLGLDAMNPFLLDASQCNDPGRSWEIYSIYIKMYACCRFSHPVLDGLSALIKENEIMQDSIKSIMIALNLKIDTYFSSSSKSFSKLLHSSTFCFSLDMRRYYRLSNVTYTPFTHQPNGI
jgi:2-methylcitrate dehydratase PrpD